MGCPVEPSLEVKLDHFAMGYLAPDELTRIIKTEIDKKQNDASEEDQGDRRALEERVSDLDKYIENLQKRVFDLEYKHKEPIV
jgi:uncharacterized protein YaaN involved in tellurite resistance